MHTICSENKNKEIRVTDNFKYRFHNMLANDIERLS